MTVENFAIKGTLALGGVDACNNNTLAHDSAINNTAFRFYDEGATDFLVEGNSFGPQAVNNSLLRDEQNYMLGCSPTKTTGGVFSHNTIHDSMEDATYTSAHYQGLYVSGGVDGVLFDSNKFYNIAVADFTIASGSPTGGNANISSREQLLWASL